MAEAVRIDAPDPLRAFILWQCLRTVGAELVELVDGRFEVRVPDDPSRRLSVPETLAIVRRWLEHERIDCTRVHIDGHPQMLRCAHSAQAGVRRNHTFSAAKARR